MSISLRYCPAAPGEQVTRLWAQPAGEARSPYAAPPPAPAGGGLPADPAGAPGALWIWALAPFGGVLASSSLLADGVRLDHTSTVPIPGGTTVDVLPPFAGG